MELYATPFIAYVNYTEAEPHVSNLGVTPWIISSLMALSFHAFCTTFTCTILM